MVKVINDPTHQALISASLSIWRAAFCISTAVSLTTLGIIDVNCSINYWLDQKNLNKDQHWRLKANAMKNSESV